MGKVVDITEKLSFDGNPYLMIKDKKLEVNADAPTMLKVMGVLSVGEPGPKEIMEMIDLMIPEESQKTLEELHLSFNDLIIVVQEAVSLITGDVAQGE